MMLNDMRPLITLSSPGAIAFQIGSVSIRWYGILIAVAFLICYFLAERLIIKNKLNLNHFSNLIFLILIFSIVFARLYFVILNMNYFMLHQDEIPKIWHGGQSIHGGIIGAVLAVLLYTRFNKISFYKYIDVITTVVPLGQAIGRWGNFFNNEAFGKPIETGQHYFYSFIQLKIPLEFRPAAYLHYTYFHPTFLYESVLDFILFIYLYKNYSSWKHKAGKVFWAYLLGYSLIRVLIEFLRTDSILFLGNVSVAQIVSIILMIISAGMLVKK